MALAVSQGAVLLDRIAVVMRQRLPSGVSPAYFDGFVHRNRRTLVAVLDQQLAQARAPRLRLAPTDLGDLPELWTPSQRTEANLKAMAIAAARRPEEMSDADRRALALYSGWGGLSIEKAAPRFPTGFPRPEARGLIHEYYTPTKVAREIARVITPLLPGLEREGVILALEPAAGIGRFLMATQGPAFARVRWNVIEWSQLSAKMLQALRPDLQVFQGPFERWVREHSDEYAGRLTLLIANPPYGPRGASIAEDPVRAYRERQAYAYFLRRGLDLLAEGGLGVFLIPGGFLTGQSERMRTLRQKVLLRHHLATAFRLPSGIFPGAELVTDLLFFRSRGGALGEVDPGDHFILDGSYFKDFPRHILGKEVGPDPGDDDQTARPRWGYQVVGEFTRLPDLVERPICGACEIVIPAPMAGSTKSTRSVGVTRQSRNAGKELPKGLADAVALGDRVDQYLSLAATEESEEAVGLHGELVDALSAWVKANGNPWRDGKLRKLVGSEVTGAERFLSAFTKAGKLIRGLKTAPVYSPRYRGRADDVVAQAEHLFRTERSLTTHRLLTFHHSVGGRLGDVGRLVQQLTEAGWALDDGHLYPKDVYLTGNLWPRYDRALALARKGDERATDQAKALLEVIAPAVFDDIDGISPRQGWVPLDLVEAWLGETLNKRYGAVELVRSEGLLQVAGTDYGEIKEAAIAPETRWCLGWINHDRTVFKPRKERREQTLDEARLAYAKEWERSFRAWVGSDPERMAQIEEAYNRRFRGFVSPTWSSEPFTLSRWVKDGIRLHPHQVAGARRILASRGGLLAFDVGVGKTYTGIAVLARARQEGWCRRPVILVPNSIIWKWAADIARVLPDYRVAVIGSKKKIITRGPRKGMVTSETDSPEDRARKWTRFQGGEYDVVLLTYSALPRTRMNEASVRAYADKTEAIRREVRLRQRNAQDAKKLTERQAAILKEGVSAWVAEMMELPQSWRYDPGIAWDDIGVDLLIVDEAQNFKNLYLPEAREGGVPRFMGNAGTGSKRAWQLDFRAAAVRRKTGGAGIVLLSATPAKNSPLEFYNLIQFIDHEAWSRMGITDPEQFIDRYLRIEMKSVVDSKMDVVERSAVVGFQNLHELRETIYRYGDFKTAEDVGLKLPEPTVNVVEVDMDDAQSDKYDRYVTEIEDALESDAPKDKAQILGLLARMAMVAIHARLDEQFTWKTANQAGVDPHSPKFDALAERVAANRTCGHIVFVDNTAAHRWVKEVLVASGVPAKRIAVLNASTAKAAADRQKIARQFNGDAEAGEAPKYDVVIANAIAYEGIDLQTRTCAIHHLDLPWEPATLQQRNGRGVRQGNTLGTIEINYYFARRSQDGLRFNLIQGKLGWMTELLKSQKRDTNNPGAQMEMGPEEVLLLISRDPEKTAARLAEVKARREAEARARLREDAARLLRSANARFRKAERTTDPTEAARLRLEGEEHLKDLAQVDPEAWPFAKWIGHAREREILVTKGGAPVWEGLRIGLPSAWDPERTEYAELGRIQGLTIGVREAGNARWTKKSLDELDAMKLEPGHFEAGWPDGEGERTDAAVVNHISQKLRWGGEWPSLGWELASDTFMARAWERQGRNIAEKLASVSDWYAQQQRVPVMVQGKLDVRRGSAIREGEVVAPTLAGWADFLKAAPKSGLKFTALNEAAQYWWGRRVPRDLLSSTRKALGEKAA